MSQSIPPLGQENFLMDISIEIVYEANSKDSGMSSSRPLNCSHAQPLIK
jgi:hypothetical protein